MLFKSIHGTMTIQFGDYSCEMKCQEKLVEIFLPSLQALNELKKSINGELSLFSTLKNHFESDFELNIYLANKLVARAGKHANPNAIARTFGLHDFEIMPAAAMSLLWAR